MITYASNSLLTLSLQILETGKALTPPVKSAECIIIPFKKYKSSTTLPKFFLNNFF